MVVWLTFYYSASTIELFGKYQTHHLVREGKSREAQLVVGAPHLSKKDVIVVPGKIRGKIPQLIPSCGLHDFDRFFVSFSMAAASPKCMPTQVVMTRDSASPANCFMRSSIMIPPSGYLLDVS